MHYLFFLIAMISAPRPPEIEVLRNGQLVDRGLAVKVLVKTGAQLQSAPDASSPSTGIAVSPFEILSVYAFDQRSRMHAVVKNGYYFVKKPGGQGTMAEGWIGKDKVLRWDHRQVVRSFGESNQPITVHATPDTNAEKGTSLPAPGSGPTKYFAIVEDATNFSNGIRQEWLKIAYLNSEDTETLGEDPIGSSEITMDIVFVIDTTNSMAPFIEGTKLAVEEVVKTLAADESHNIRFGLVAFRDSLVENPALEYDTRYLMPLERDKVKFVDTLKKTAASPSPNTDKPEALFDGVDLAVSESTWDEKALKVVIAITDASGHPPGSSASIKKLSAKDVAQAMADKDIRFIGFQVNNPDAKEDLTLLKSQFKTLARLDDLKTPGLVTPVQYDKPEYTDELMDELFKHLNIRRLLSDDQGEVDTQSFTTADWVYIRNRNLSGKATYTTGWIPKSSQTHVAIMISRPELQRLVGLLSFASSYLGNPQDQSLLNTMISSLNAQTGESIQFGQQQTFDSLKARLGLPIKKGLLAFSPNDVLGWPQSRIKEEYDRINGKMGAITERLYTRPDLWRDFHGTSYTFLPIEALP